MQKTCSYSSTSASRPRPPARPDCAAPQKASRTRRCKLRSRQFAIFARCGPRCSSPAAARWAPKGDKKCILQAERRGDARGDHERWHPRRKTVIPDGLKKLENRQHQGAAEIGCAKNVGKFSFGFF